jgi:hypothetical protein
MDAKAFEKKSHDFYQQIFLAKNPAGKKLAAFRGGKKLAAFGGEKISRWKKCLGRRRIVYVHTLSDEK